MNNDEKDRREKVQVREVTESFLWAESVEEREFPFCYYSKQTWMPSATQLGMTEVKSVKWVLSGLFHPSCLQVVIWQISGKWKGGTLGRVARKSCCACPSIHTTSLCGWKWSWKKLAISFGIHPG